MRILEKYVCHESVKRQEVQVGKNQQLWRLLNYCLKDIVSEVTKAFCVLNYYIALWKKPSLT